METSPAMTGAVDSTQLGAGRMVRAATPDDIAQIRAHLVEAIDTSPYYNDAFKNHEKARLGADFLLALISADPWYVPVICYKGKMAGFVLTTPEVGVLCATWIYVSPDFRQTAIAIAAIGSLIRHWDHGRFHKISCYVRPENTRAESVMMHFGFTQTALLRTHMFGEDYLLLERPLTKAADDYSPGLRLGRINLMRLRLTHALRRKGLSR